MIVVVLIYSSMAKNICVKYYLTAKMSDTLSMVSQQSAIRPPPVTPFILLSSCWWWDTRRVSPVIAQTWTNSCFIVTENRKIKISRRRRRHSNWQRWHSFCFTGFCFVVQLPRCCCVIIILFWVGPAAAAHPRGASVDDWLHAQLVCYLFQQQHRLLLSFFPIGYAEAPPVFFPGHARNEIPTRKFFFF